MWTDRRDWIDGQLVLRAPTWHQDTGPRNLGLGKAPEGKAESGRDLDAQECITVPQGRVTALPPAYPRRSHFWEGK